MEWKGNRTSPGPRSSFVDSKKDVVSKPWLRGGKCRESATRNNFKGESSNKPSSQKNKSMDKRPKPRGKYSTNISCRNQATLLDEVDAQLCSAIPGSKTQNLNHLLNFTYADSPREISHHSFRNIGGASDRNGKINQISPTMKHKYKKEDFLQANCQFIVNEFGNYKQYLNNPDALVDWKYVEQVNILVSEYPSCPICLYHPTAAKMTRCGHIYCWHCILHYLSLSDELSRKCPICIEYVRKTELISVVAIPHSSFNINDTITFKLMKKVRGELITYPSVTKFEDRRDLFQVSETNSKNIYSKLLLAKRDDVLAIISREKDELDLLLKENSPSEECYIQEAIALLMRRKDEVLHKTISYYEYDEGLTLSNLDTNNSNTKSVTGNENPGHSSSDGKSPIVDYFYQASDGQHIYLNSLNAKMLALEYNSLDKAPERITGKLLEKVGDSMTLELRKRWKFLQHLPITCRFEVAEIDLRDHVSKETLNHFHKELEEHRKARKQKEKNEERRQKMIEVEENRKIGIFVTPEIHIDSNLQFPKFGTDHRSRCESESAFISERSTSPELDVSTSSITFEETCAGPSFATMLASKKNQSEQWPSLGSAEKPKLINVTGSKLSPNSTNTSRVFTDAEFYLEDYEPVPSYSASFSDSVGEALEAVKIEADQPTSGKKKKKSKKKVLFATNMACLEK